LEVPRRTKKEKSPEMQAVVGPPDIVSHSCPFAPANRAARKAKVDLAFVSSFGVRKCDDGDCRRGCGLSKEEGPENMVLVLLCNDIAGTAKTARLRIEKCVEKVEPDEVSLCPALNLT
jgi:hypothetical protein